MAPIVANVEEEPNVLRTTIANHMHAAMVRGWDWAHNTDNGEAAEPLADVASAGLLRRRFT